jgi:hypothetical protein
MSHNRTAGQAPANWTRRTVLSTGAKAAVTAGILPAAALLAGQDERIVVGVHLFGPALDQQAGQTATWVNEAHEGQVVASGRGATEDRYEHLRFVEGGFVAAAWTTGQHTYTFSEGFTLSSSTKLEGSAHDNAVLRAVIDEAQLPAGGLQRQLGAAGLLAAKSRTLGLKNVSMLATLGGFGAKRDERRKAAERELAQSVAQLRRFTKARGLNERVLIYTDSDVHQGVGEVGNQPAHVAFNAPAGLFERGFDAGLASWVGVA